MQAFELRIHSFHMHLSYGGHFCFLDHLAALHSPSSSAVFLMGSQHPLDHSFGSPHYIWRPEITDACDISYLLIWQEILSYSDEAIKDL